MSAGNISQGYPITPSSISILLLSPSPFSLKSSNISLMNQQIISFIGQNLGLFCRGSQVPCISQNTESFLKSILHHYKPKRILEIGTAYGYGMLHMANIVSQWGGSIIGCERAYPNRVEISKLLSLCKHYGLKNIDCQYGAFLRINPLVRGNMPFDFVFIDAQKAEYPLYLDSLLEHGLINNNSILVFDDVIKYQDRMSGLEAQLEQLGYHIQKHQLDEDDGVIVSCKKINTIVLQS